MILVLTYLLIAIVDHGPPIADCCCCVSPGRLSVISHEPGVPLLISLFLLRNKRITRLALETLLVYCDPRAWLDSYDTATNLKAGQLVTRLSPDPFSRPYPTQIKQMIVNSRLAPFMTCLCRMLKATILPSYGDDPFIFGLSLKALLLAGEYDGASAIVEEVNAAPGEVSAIIMPYLMVYVSILGKSGELSLADHRDVEAR